MPTLKELFNSIRRRKPQWPVLKSGFKFAAPDYQKVWNDAYKAGSQAHGYDFSQVIPLTHNKAQHIIERDSYAVTGFVLTKDRKKCVVDMSAVRWFDERLDFQRMMHPDAQQKPTYDDGFKAGAETERERFKKIAENTLGWVRATDRDKAFNEPDFVGEMVSIRLTGLTELAELVRPGRRKAAYEGFVAQIRPGPVEHIKTNVRIVPLGKQAESDPADPYNGDDGPGFDYEFHAKLLAGAHLLSDEQKEVFDLAWGASKEFFSGGTK